MTITSSMSRNGCKYSCGTLITWANNPKTDRVFANSVINYQVSVACTTKKESEEQITTSSVSAILYKTNKQTKKNPDLCPYVCVCIRERE